MTELEEWRDRAACRGRSTAAFFPVDQDRRLLPALRRFCGECPVAAECLDYAIANRELVGVWSGTTVEERAAMRVARSA